jgi:sugar phosphate isomerase/epimerase
LKLSCSAIAWGQIKDVPSFEKILDSIKETGYEGVGIEYNLLPKELMEHPEEIHRLARRAGLGVPSMAINEMTVQQADAAKKMGAESAWLCLFEKDDAAASKATNTLLRAFRAQNVAVGLHPHVRSNAESYRQIDALIEKAKPLSLDICFDSAHQEALGIDNAQMIRRYKDRLVLAHMKDLRARVPIAKVDYDHDFVDLGEGVVDFEAIMRAFKDVGYKGWLMTEVDYAHDESVEESIKKNYDFLVSLL